MVMAYQLHLDSVWCQLLDKAGGRSKHSEPWEGPLSGLLSSNFPDFASHQRGLLTPIFDLSICSDK